MDAAVADGVFGRAWRGNFERLKVPAACLPSNFDGGKRRPAASGREAAKTIRDVAKRLQALRGGHDRAFSALGADDCSLAFRPLDVDLPDVGGELLFGDEDIRVHRDANGDAVVATRVMPPVGGPGPKKKPLKFLSHFA